MGSGPLEESLELADRLSRSSVWGLSLIGGEPLAVPGFLGLAALLKSRGKRVSVGTNGLLLEGFAEDLVRLGLDAVHVSVDSHLSEVHDELRNTPGLLDAIERGVGQIRRARRRLGLRRPRVLLRTTVHRRNFLALEQLFLRWEGKVDGILLQPLQDNSIHQVRDRSLLLEPDDEPRLVEVLGRLQRRYPFLRNAYFDLLPEYLFRAEALGRKLGFQCLLVPGTSLTVTPRGDAMLCFGAPDSVVGNLLEEPMAEVWRRSATRALQRRMAEEPCAVPCWETHQLYNLYLLRLLRPFRSTGGRS